MKRNLLRCFMLFICIISTSIIWLRTPTELKSRFINIVVRKGELNKNTDITSQFFKCRKDCISPYLVSTSGQLPPWTDRVLSHNMTKHIAFKPRISTYEHGQLMDLMTVFRQACERNNISYMLHGGTLIGSYRHFGMIPWDDDLDVLANRSQKPQLQSVLSKVPGHVLSTDTIVWKFYRNVPRGHLTNERWPFIDVLFFAENSTHIWDDNKLWSSTYCYKKTIVFPLMYLKFENNLFPAPRYTREFLTTTFDIDRCETNVYSHKFETTFHGPSGSLPCRQLYEHLPFVFRSCYNDSFSEQLVKRNRTLYAQILRCCCSR